MKKGKNMVIDCKISTKEYFKERPEDILWYRLYRNDKILIYQSKRWYFDKCIEIAEIPICLRLYKYYFKIGNTTYINIKEVLRVEVEPYINSKYNKLYHLVIQFKENKKRYIELDDHNLYNVLSWKRKIVRYIDKVKSGR